MNSFFEKLRRSAEASVESAETLSPSQEGKEEISVVEEKPQIEKKPRGRKAKEKGVEKTVQEKNQKWFELEGKIAIDIYQTDSHIVIHAPIAGVKKEDLDISIENDMITIRGKRENPADGSQINYFSQECFWGPFSREIILPTEGDPSRTEAVFKDGVLTLKIPKIDREKKKIIELKE